MAKKVVAFERCLCGKRGWADENDAEKALGRAQSKRRRAMESAGTRRGVVKVESRVYPCEVGDLLHLTSESRREYNDRVVVPTLTWEQWQINEGKVAA